MEHKIVDEFVNFTPKKFNYCYQLVADGFTKRQFERQKNLTWKSKEIKSCE
jgi:hypothetical protein